MNNIEHKGDASDWLRLDRQVCFPLYAATNLMQRLYRPLLAPLGLTYSQYLVLLVLWERGSASAVGSPAVALGGVRTDEGHCRLRASVSGRKINGNKS